MKNLINLNGGDRLNLRVEGQILLSESIKNGKTRQTQKEFASAGEAQKACVKKEWESLKKKATSCKTRAQKRARRACTSTSAADTRTRWRLRALRAKISSINAAATKKTARSIF